MHLKVTGNAELQQCPETGTHHWRSMGDDPQLEFAFGLVRSRFVCISLIAAHTEIDPCIYVNFGRGYREVDCLRFGKARHFIFLLDVGRFGVVRSFRLDPASLPCEFELKFCSFKERDSADAWLVRQRDEATSVARVTDVGRLPRFVFPQLSFYRRAVVDKVDAYISTCYSLAEHVEALRLPYSSEVWLSIVVPVYNAPQRHLDDLYRSFQRQAISGVEIIFSDDGSQSSETKNWLRRAIGLPGVKVVNSSSNTGIAAATNRGLETALGKWVTFLDHDDLIAPHALKMILNALSSVPRAQFLYTDELIVDDRLRPRGLMLKPAYDSVLLTGVNYINHFSIYERSRLLAIGGFRAGFEGSQDYDLLLRFLEGVPESEVLHLPYPAYWWRRTDKSYSRLFLEDATEAARRAILEAFARKEIKARVEPALTQTLHKVEFSEVVSWPLVSVIIPSRDAPDLIKRIINDIYERTDYPNLEVIVVDNGSTDPRVTELYQETKRRRENFRYFVETDDFNFSRAVNKGMQHAVGEHFLILNNDIEVIQGSWLKEMVSCLNFEGTGIVGAKLLYPNGKIQHAGVIVGLGGLAGHWYLNCPSNFGGPMNRLHVRNSMTCVTGAVMLISRKCADLVGSWDEENFAIAYNDVDYCIRAFKLGIRIVWTPFAFFYHHESASRGADAMGERKRRFESEKRNLRRLHQTEQFEDPTSNPGYGKANSYLSFELPTRPSPPRRRWWES